MEAIKERKEYFEDIALRRENTENKFLSADDIAAASGFSGRCNYYRICKRMTGMSPDELKYSLTCKKHK